MAVYTSRTFSRNGGWDRKGSNPDPYWVESDPSRLARANRDEYERKEREALVELKKAEHARREQEQLKRDWMVVAALIETDKRTYAPQVVQYQPARRREMEQARAPPPPPLEADPGNANNNNNAP